MGRVVSTTNVEARFIISAARPEQFPAEDLDEIAFLGRSNVGKSSLINRLVGLRGLARTSARPGATRTINFYRVAGSLLLVDLPGYGYQAGPASDTRAWKRLIEEYLKSRRSLKLAILLVDVRRGWMEKDRDLQRWLEAHGRRYLVVATKLDKLKTQVEQRRGLAAIRDHCGELEPVPFSAVTGQGARTIWQAIWRIKTP